MKNLFLFINKIKFFLFFIFLQIIIFRIIVSNSSYQQSGYLNSSSDLSGWVFNKVQSIKDYFNLTEVNEKLAIQNAFLRQESFHNYTIVSENEVSIQKKLYKKKYLFQPSKLIQNSTRKRRNILTIDVGENRNVKSEMGVVAANGIVGFIRNISSHYSTVLSVMNQDISIPVKLLNDSCKGTLYWDKKDEINQVTVKEIPSYFKIKIGDSIVTQGGSGIFPPNEMVGTVTKIFNEAGSNNLLLKLKTSVDFNAIDNVFIVKNIYKEELDSINNISQ